MERKLQGTFELVPFQGNESLLMYLNRETVDYSTHWHTAAELIMPIQESYCAIIGNQRYELMPNDILFIPSGVLHSLEAPESGERMVFLFNATTFSSQQDFSALLPVLNQPQLITEEDECHDEALALVHRMIEIYPDRTEPLRTAMLYSHLLRLFVLIGQRRGRRDLLAPEVRTRRQSDCYERLNASLNFINSNYMNDISVEDAAKIAGFSKFHFSRLFKQFTDQTFCGYLNHCRINAAESLLLNPRLSVTDVALQSGFSSLSTFNRTFRTLKSCTPSEFKGFHESRGRSSRRRHVENEVSTSNMPASEKG